MEGSKGGEGEGISNVLGLNCAPFHLRLHLKENKVFLRFTAGCTIQTPPPALSFALWCFLQIQVETNFPGLCCNKDIQASLMF